MRKIYLPSFYRNCLLALTFVLYSSAIASAQTTISTIPNPPYNGSNSAGANTAVTFVVENTNPFPILLNNVSTWINTADANSTLQLWYSSTSLSGLPAIATPAWTMINQVTGFPAPAVNGITPVWTNLGFTIPAGTQYRFAVWYVTNGSRYSGTAVGTVTPTSFSAGGVNLKLGEVQIAGSYVGYAGSNNPRWWTGAITFEPAGPCTNPPVPGTLVSTASNACLGIPFTLSLTGGTGGTGQTYQWQVSPDNSTWTNIPGATNATLTTSQSVSNYYRVIVTCGVSVNSNSQLVTTAAAVSGTFTINSALPTGGTNFQSFNAAYDYIKCGINAPVILNVDATSGPYNEQLIMAPVPGASATNTVTFNGNGRTIQFTSANTNERATIKLNGADHIKFNNLVINANGSTTTEYGFGVQLLNNADSNTVNNCRININTTSTSTNYAGISVSGLATSATSATSTLSDGNRFTNNIIEGGYYGITLASATAEANRDNVISGNQVNNFYFYGIYVSGSFNTLIDSNTISRPTRATVSTATFMGIYFTGLSVSCKVTRNTITNPFGGAPATTAVTNGIHFTGVSSLANLENVVTNNRLYNFTGAGEVNAIHNINSDNVFYYHNSILLDGTGGTAIARGFYQTTEAAGIRFQNNIISVTRGGSGAKYAIYFNTIASDIISNRNDFFLNASSNDFTGFYTAARATLADWQAASGDDANSVASNPFFANAASGNLAPTNAGIDNLGTPVGVLIDINGAARSLTTPDLGAYEFAPGACSAPPVAGNATVSATPVCVNTSIQLGLLGNSTGLGQTYQWQTSATIGGTYTNLGNVLTNPDSTILAGTTLYYRAGVTCAGNTVYSTPVLLSVNPALPAGTYTINAGAPASASNYVSFNAAKAALSCGIAGPIVFNVVSGSGPYNEQLVLDSIAGTSAVNTVTFNGNGNTIAFSSSDNLERAVIKLRTTDHIIFDSLVINATGAGTYGYGVQLVNNADSNKFNNCTILANTTATSANFAGIVVNNSESAATTTGNTSCDGNIFSNNTITGGYYGITLVGGTTATTTPVMNNRITGNNITDFYFYGIYLGGNDNTLVEANRISRPTRAGTTTVYGVYMTGLSTNVKISKNRISNPFGGNPASTSLFGGIYITGVDAPTGQENIVSNNLVSNVTGGGTLYGLYNSSSASVKYYYNTISLDDNANTSTSAAYGFYQITLADGIELRNNLITVSRAGSGNKFGLYYSTATTVINSNYNNIYVTGTNAYTGYEGANQVTLANWQAATGQDANSVSLDPFYSNPVTGNFMPMSPVLDNKGVIVTGITSDILNTTRSVTTPDIGAYEFTVPPCTTPPVAGAAAAVPSSGICLGSPINLSLGGYSFGSGQTYQWQFATVAAGPYTNLGGSRLFPDTTIFATSTLYYRATVTCGGNTQFSSPVLVTINPAFLAGTYTINSTIPASAINFTSFASAVAALDCGITGPVFFDVAPNTYTEQIRMRAIAGTSPTVRVTFRSANGDPGSVILTNNATVAANNYTLKLDSTSYVTYKNMTIGATNATNGRVIELASTASFDSIVNCRINAPVSAATANTIAGIYADVLIGGGHVIKNNVISNGSSGIYLEGSSTTNLTRDNVLDSNTINGSYYYGIYIGMNARIRVNKNTVNVAMPRNATNYGIYSTSSDSAYQYTANTVLINGITATTTYGMYFTGCDAGQNTRGRIAGNTITALTGNTGSLYGLYQTASTFNNTVNNVISISTTGATAYASYYTTGGGVRFHNNTIMNSSPSTGTTNAAAYFSQTSGTNPSVNVQNNIFTHRGAGNAFYMANLNFVYSNYNTYHTASAPLFRTSATVTYATLPLWINFSNWDYNSINFEPKLLDNTSLRPDPASPEVWAIHGRGTQLAGNDYDFNNNPRPTTFTAGVPDMGAYEFLPTSLPTLLTATPATPAAGTTQTFMYGTDTVAKITYAAGAPVPASINLRRYSGVLPTGLATGQQSMYFYTDIDVPAQGAYKYKVDQYYIDPWRGFIPTEEQIQLGKTNAANAWVVQPTATTNVFDNIMSDTGQVFIDKFTGLTGNPPNTGSGIYTTVSDSSNSGTRFWVPYGHHQAFSNNAQDMWLYLSTKDSANVTVRINGTNWVRTYAIPANTVRVSDLVPKSGLVDARIDNEGLYEHGVSIVSDVPIVAYAHIYSSATSGASLLLPVGIYGYEYQSLNARQQYGSDTYSWMSIMTDRDSTLVEVTPSVTTRGGRPAGVPFTVTLMRGQVYNIMGTVTGTTGTDLSGTKVKSIANPSGNCYPVAVFSGNSRTNICNTTNGDNMIQQVFPSQAWGRKYPLFATASSLSNTTYYSNLYRVMVKDPTTVVLKNGVALDPATLVVPGNYYEFSTNQGSGASTASYIEANKPIMVAQYMISSDGDDCGLTPPGGDGDPEMIYVSPIEQGIKRAAFYNTDRFSINSNYVNIIIPTTGLTSLRIDGTVSTFTDVFAHPFLPGYSCVRHNLGGNPGQHTVTSDSAFTAITYGLGSVESYGYNAGTLVKNLNVLASITNTLGASTTSEYTCVNAPFRFSALITSKPTILTWKLSEIPNLTPGVDVVQNNPQPTDSVFSNGRWFYKFVIPADYRFSQPGTYTLKLLLTDPVNIEGCNSVLEIRLPIRVLPAPTISFTAPAVCLGNTTVFTGIGGTSNNVPINTWNWAFGDNTTGNTQNTTHTYATAGTFNVRFSLIAQDGCFADTTRQVIVNPGPTVSVVQDSLVVCGATPATFQVQNPVTGSTYQWFSTATGGTALATGTSYTIASVTGTTVVYVQPTTSAGCIGGRVRVVATLLPDLAIPVVRVDSVGVDRVIFSWNAIPNALSYQVSTNAGSTWSTPSSGSTGLTHTVLGLAPLTDVTLQVRAVGSAPCQVSVSLPVTQKTRPDQIYIPNSFTPNGDGLNDMLLVYGYTIRNLRFMVFNQWGEKVFESTNQASGWNGTYRGKAQPGGVYMYVCQLTLLDGTTLVKKGSINLVR